MSSFRFSDAIDEGRLRLHTDGAIRCVTYPALDSLPGVSALTTLRNESWPAPTTGQKLLPVAGPSLARILGIPPQNLVAGRQVHSTNVLSLKQGQSPASSPSEPLIVPSTDGLLTNVPQTGLIVVTADCLPVFLYDAKRSVIGLLHCGRAGTFADIVGVGLSKMQRDFGSDPADCTAVIGPSIGPCCYEVDLWAANERRLKQLGVSSVVNCRVCTKCNSDHFYSYRAEREHAGRMISAIALK